MKEAHHAVRSSLWCATAHHKHLVGNCTQAHTLFPLSAVAAAGWPLARPLSHACDSLEASFESAGADSLAWRRLQFKTISFIGLFWHAALYKQQHWWASHPPLAQASRRLSGLPSRGDENAIVAGRSDRRAHAICRSASYQYRTFGRTSAMSCERTLRQLLLAPPPATPRRTRPPQIPLSSQPSTALLMTLSRFPVCPRATVMHSLAAGLTSRAMCAATARHRRCRRG
jgi:hypothetical protein